MAELSPQERADCFAAFMRRLSAEGESVDWTKAQGLAALGALDTWYNENAATINQALPAAFRTSATTAQKARLSQFVTEWRYVKGV